MPSPSSTSLYPQRTAFLLCLVSVLVLALMPSSPLPPSWWDKASHVVAFTVLAVLGCWSYPGRSAKVLLWLLAYGCLIEVLQATLTATRSAELGDVVADGAGLLLGWQLTRVIRQIHQYATTRRPGSGSP
jgi:VanZ family protein